MSNGWKLGLAFAGAGALSFVVAVPLFLWVAFAPEEEPDCFEVMQEVGEACRAGEPYACEAWVGGTKACARFHGTW